MKLGLIFSLALVATAACAKTGHNDPGLTGDCPGDKEFFRVHLWEPILSVQCIGCHNADGLAKDTHLILVPNTDPSALDTNYATVRMVATIKYENTPVLLLRPEGKHPEGHKGGTLIAEGSQAYADLKTFVDHVNGAPCDSSSAPSCDPAKPSAGQRLLRRLTNFEYDRTLQDLLGIAPKYGYLFPPDDVVHGFDDNAAALHVAPLYTDKARSAAEDIASQAALDKLVPCDVANGDATCAASFIAKFGLRAFRRPLTDAETKRYAALHAAVAANEGFEGGVRAILAAMLQSPSFLYRTELGTPSGAGFVLTPYEIASELSYMITGSMPDDALFAVAASGDLAKPEVIAAQAQRLLQTDGARALLEHFARQWLELNLLQLAVKDPNVYPSFSPEIRDAMYAETVATFTSTMRADGATFATLLTGDTTWTSDALAQYYGLSAPTGPADPNGLKPYKTGNGRLGLLTQGAILASQAKPDRPSPVHRGKLVREQIFCQTLPPPPPGVNAQLPPVDPNVPNRDRFTQHSQNQPCWSCHRLMDPIGFGFEGFDGIGKPLTKPVDTSGEIMGTTSTDQKFDGVPALAKILANSADAQACFALEWYRFAYGLDEAKDTSCLAPSIANAFKGGGLRLGSILVALTATDHFVRRDPDVAGGAPPPPPPPLDDAGPPPPPPAEGGAPPPPPSNVDVSVHTDSMWQGGYCDTVTVKNTSSSSVTWTVTLPADGTLTQVWSASETTSGSSWTFVGASFNATLPPAGTGSFGLCAAK